MCIIKFAHSKCTTRCSFLVTWLNGITNPSKWEWHTSVCRLLAWTALWATHQMCNTLSALASPSRSPPPTPTVYRRALHGSRFQGIQSMVSWLHSKDITVEGLCLTFWTTTKQFPKWLHQQRRIPCSPQPHQHLLISLITILASVKRYTWWVFLISTDVEYLFIY